MQVAIGPMLGFSGANQQPQDQMAGMGGGGGFGQPS